MHKKLMSSILLIFMLTFSINAIVLAQNTAQVGETLEGGISDTQWELFLESGQVVQIDLQSEAFDTILDLRNAAGELLMSNDDLDFPSNQNSQIIFTAPETGTYILGIRSFGSDSPDGAYTLTIEELELTNRMSGGELTYGSQETIVPNGAIIIEFTFNGEVGEVVNISAVSDLNEDTSLLLYDPNGNEVASADDSRSSINPFVIRFNLPESGEYRIEIRGFNEQALFAPLIISLEATEELLLNETAQSIALGSSQTQDIMVLNVQARQAYLINIRLDRETASSLFFDIQEGDESFAGTRLSFSGTQDVSFLFVADTDGQVRFNLNFFSLNDEDIEITVEVTTIEN